MSGCHNSELKSEDLLPGRLLKVSKQFLLKPDLDPLIDILKSMNQNMLLCRLEIEHVRQLLRKDDAV